MPQPSDELIPTRATLLQRLKDWQDQTSWQEFFDTYWKLIYSVAKKSGMTNTEAQDVIQDTMFAVAKHMPTFKYDPAIGSFKTWLLNLTRWRIIDQVRKRDEPEKQVRRRDNGVEAVAVEQVVDPSSNALDEIWDQEWSDALLEAAVAKVKRRVDPRNYQLFDFYVGQGWSADKVASTFGVSVEQVYMAKHRMTELIAEEVRRLEKEMT